MAGKLTETQWREMEQRYRRGESCPQLAQDFPLSRSGINQGLVKRGVPMRSSRGPGALREQRLYELYWCEELTLAEVSDRTGASIPYLIRQMNAAGIRRRNRTEALALARKRGRRIDHVVMESHRYESLRRWREEHPEEDHKRALKAAAAQWRGHAAWLPCAWCGQKVRKALSRAKRSQCLYCSPSHAQSGRAWRRWHIDAARPLILAKLWELWRNNGRPATTSFQFRRLRLELLGGEIGATDAEYAEIMAEWASGG